MINIAELLKNAPKDLELYSPICGHCKLSCILYDDGIRVIAHDVPFRFDKYGRFCSADDAECLLFPSEDCRTWEGRKLPIEPKFKVGDSLQSGSHFTKILSINLEEGRYYCDNRIISFKNQDLWHLVPKPHYDINNFHAGVPVLVRETSLNTWQYVLFSHCYIGGDGLTRFNAGLVGFTQCIPFNEDTKHLLGTTDMCDERFINW